ncbi:TerC family protein [Erwinia sp. AnSW2-5]|uniref:TerC family protein n=1 Tax=Erwinia sp. AnSW2-5 TaxID=3367692 RepID=UPI00385BF8F9
MLMWFEHLDFAVILLQIVLIDLLLGGDNAVVIALACRKLPPHMQKKAIILGTLGAIVARVVLLIIAVHLLALPWLKVVGGLLLLWIGFKLVGNEEEEATINGDNRLWKTVLTITLADVVMSLDNVLAVAAAGKGNVWLVSFGVLISIPIIVMGSKLVLTLLSRFPFIVTLGGALIGWIAGSMLVTDPALLPYTAAIAYLYWMAGAIGALLVVGYGVVRRERAS